MKTMDLLIAELAEVVPAQVGGDEAGLDVVVSEVEFDLPIEARIEAQGLIASTPRGRLDTGFSVPHGRLRLRLRERGPGEGGAS